MASTQFRSPTTEQSYLVAQVHVNPLSPPEGYTQFATDIPARIGHSAVWDYGRQRILIFGGVGLGAAYLNDLWAFYPATGVIEELTTTGTPPSGRYKHSAIYSPDTEEMIVYGGHDGAATNDVFALNCVSLVWSSIGVGPGARYEHAAMWRSGPNTMVISGGANTGPSDLYPAFDYWSMDLDTHAWTQASTSGYEGLEDPAQENRHRHCITEDYSGAIYLVGGIAWYGAGQITDCWKLTGSVWAEQAAPPLATQDSQAAGFSSALIVSHENGNFYTLVGGAWTTVAVSIGAFFYHSYTLTDYLVGYVCSATADNIQVDTEFIIYIVGGIFEGEGTLPWTESYGLYACDDHLPTTTGVFESIYEFTSVPGICTFAPLNDRLVITEGVSDVPLVWGGTLAADASDWMHVLHCLIAQDGVRFYDVSAEVCDKDPDTVAQVGGIRRWGWIAFCTDMPTITGFYIDVETPNTGSEGTTTSTFYEPIVIDAAADVTRQDLRATITNWVQSAGATGHFTDGAATVTLGPGNDNEDFIPGLLIKFADAEVIITAIVGDGSGADSVTLSAAHITAGVDAAYGTTVDTTGLSVVYQTDAATSTWSQVYNITPTNLAGYSIRMVIPASAITTSGDHIQVTLQAAKASWMGTAGFGADHVSIVERSGSTANGTTTPTELLFDGTSGCSTSAVAEEVTSDLTPFAIDETKDYLVIIDMSWASISFQGEVYRAGFVATMQGDGSGTAYLKDGGWGNEEVSYNLQTVTDFVLRDKPVCVNNIDVATLEAVPSNTYVAHTTDGIQTITSAWEEFQGIEVEAVTPGASLLYLAVSFDARATFWVFDASAWRQIVRENGGAWEYNDSATAAPNWVAAAVDSLLGALREAFTVVQNQMTITEIEAITSAQWAGTNGFIPHVSTNLDFAVAMAADGSDVPRLSGFTLQYADAGQAIMQVWKSGAWTDVPGDWTDDTIADGNRLGQSGIIGGTTEETADYHVLDGVPGYWWRLLTNGTSPTCAITRVRYQAPCQPLANIGDGTPDILTAFILQDTATGQMSDGARKLADNNETPVGTFPFPMKIGDFAYIMSDLPFNQFELVPFGDSTDATFTNNQIASVLTVEFWNGEAYEVVTVTDGTDVAGATIGQQGRVSFTLPSGWKTNIPFDAYYNRGYTLRLSVSADLTATTGLSEARVYNVPLALKKHKFVSTFGNRIALANRLDAPNQIDISREFAEYGWCGADSASFNLGGQDQITCAVSAYNGLLIGKTETFHYAPEGSFSFNTVEAARQVPINTQCIVKAPVSGFDSGERYGLFFLNRWGVYFNTGLHTDSAFNTSRGQNIADFLDWWQSTTYPRLDLDYLHLACGTYWPAKNWIVWAVPMLWDSGSAPQVTNNCLIVFDKTINAWLAPFTFPFNVASLTNAYHYNANAPGKLGDLGLYAGTYEGEVVRIFDLAETDDMGTAISGFVKQGYVSYGVPDTEKEVHLARIYGRTLADKVTLTVTGLLLRQVDALGGAFAQATQTKSVDFTAIAGISEPGIDFAQLPDSVRGNVLEYKIEFTEWTEILAVELGIDGIRDMPPMG